MPDSRDSANFEVVSEVVSRYARTRHLDLMVEVPCPMKQRFKTEYDRFERDLVRAGGSRPFSFVPTMCPSHIEIDRTLRDIGAMESIDRVPDLMIGMVFGDMIFTDFLPKFVKTGCFAEVIDPLAMPFEGRAGLVDRYGAFNPLALFPEVLLVDRRVLGDRPVPRRLEDLLDPVYEGMIAVPDQHDEIGVRFLMYLYKMYGEAGLDAFERNALTGFVGPDGARTAGTNADPAAAIYLTPWIFAQGAHAPGRVDIVWPEDGVFVQPIALLVRKDMDPANEQMLSWLLSEDVGRIFAENHFISTNPRVDNGLPPEVDSISWIGWDWLYDADIHGLKAALERRFERFHRPSMC